MVCVLQAALTALGSVTLESLSAPLVEDVTVVLGLLASFVATAVNCELRRPELSAPAEVHAWLASPLFAGGLLPDEAVISEVSSLDACSAALRVLEAHFKLGGMAIRPSAKETVTSTQLAVFQAAVAHLRLSGDVNALTPGSTPSKPVLAKLKVPYLLSLQAGSHVQTYGEQEGVWRRLLEDAFEAGASLPAESASAAQLKTLSEKLNDLNDTSVQRIAALRGVPFSKSDPSASVAALLEIGTRALAQTERPDPSAVACYASVGGAVVAQCKLLMRFQPVIVQLTPGHEPDRRLARSASKQRLGVTHSASFNRSMPPLSGSLPMHRSLSDQGGELALSPSVSSDSGRAEFVSTSQQHVALMRVVSSGALNVGVEGDAARAVPGVCTSLVALGFAQSTPSMEDKFEDLSKSISQFCLAPSGFPAPMLLEAAKQRQDAAAGRLAAVQMMRTLLQRPSPDGITLALLSRWCDAVTKDGWSLLEGVRGSGFPRLDAILKARGEVLASVASFLVHPDAPAPLLHTCVRFFGQVYAPCDAPALLASDVIPVLTKLVLTSSSTPVASRLFWTLAWAISSWVEAAEAPANPEPNSTLWSAVKSLQSKVLSSVCEVLVGSCSKCSSGKAAPLEPKSVRVVSDSKEADVEQESKDDLQTQPVNGPTDSSVQEHIRQGLALLLSLRNSRLGLSALQSPQATHLAVSLWSSLSPLPLALQRLAMRFVRDALVNTTEGQLSSSLLTVTGNGSVSVFLTSLLKAVGAGFVGVPRPAVDSTFLLAAAHSAEVVDEYTSAASALLKRLAPTEFGAPAISPESTPSWSVVILKNAKSPSARDFRRVRQSICSSFVSDCL